MMRKMLIAGAFALIAAGVSAGPMPKYRVKTTADEHTNFLALKTYAWEPLWNGYDATANAQIVAAVDHELQSLGFSQVASGQSDVVVRYSSLIRTDVDVKAKKITPSPDETRPEYQVGSLLVLMLAPGDQLFPQSRKELFRGRVDTPIGSADANLQGTIDFNVAQIFAAYPTRQPKKVKH
jgi:hypothetical protein